MLIHRMATDAAARRAVRVLALLLVAIATPRAAVASDATDLYYPEDGPVRALADADFDALVAENGREAWVVAFHADGCVSCDDMAPHFAKAARTLSGIVRFAHVRAGEDSDASAIVRAAGLTKVPAILGFPAHKTVNPYTGAVAKQPEEYRNSTTSSKRIADFAASLLPNDAVRRVDARDAFLAALEPVDGERLPVSILVTSKKETGALHKSLALRFRNRARFVEIAAVDVQATAPELSVAEADAPAFFASRDADAGDFERHEGAMAVDALREFLERAAAPVPEDDAPEARDPRTGDVVRPKRAADDAKGPSEEARASPFPAIGPDAFEASVLASPIGQLVLFTRLGDAKCARVSAAVGEALRKIAGHVNAGEVNVSAASAAALQARYAPATVPDAGRCAALALFPHGDKTELDPEYFPLDDDVLVSEKATVDVTEDPGEPSRTRSEPGRKIDPKALSAWVHDRIPDFVASLSSATVETFLRASPITPKLVAFPKGEKKSRAFVALAANVGDDFLFASVPESDAAAAEQFGVQTRPALRLLYLPPGEPGASPGEEGAQYAAAAFPAPSLAYAPMQMWVRQIQAQVLGKELDEAMGGDGASGEKREKANVRFADDAAALDAACAETPLCAVAFLARPSAAGDDDDARAAFEKQTLAVETAAGLAASLSSHATFVFVDVVAQRTFASAFEVTPSDAPRFVVASARKNRFATHFGAFDARSLASFLEDVLSARAKTRMVQEIPSLVDGGEGACEPEVFEDVEEEFDLSDIMSEEVEGEVSKAQAAARVERELAEEAAAAAAAEAREEEAAAAARKKAKKKAKKKKKKKQNAEL